jgi:hypothetical protein
VFQRHSDFISVWQALKAGDYVEANRLKDLIESEKRAEKALRERCLQQPRD